MTQPKASSQPRYTINLHDTLTQEKHVNNGKEYPFFVVVKNVPFIIVVSSKGEAPNFKKNSISARLLYDCEPSKEVTLIRSSPLEYVTHISSNGEEMTIEARIHVLTSQHEDSLFRVCVTFNDQEILSDPLKVISKADNTRKPREKGSPGTPATTTSSIKKKRTASDAFGDVLYRIDQQQQEQRKMINSLCEQNALLMTQLKQCTELLQQNQHQQTYSDSANCKSLDIDTAFSSFINSYASIPPMERPLKVRAIKKSLKLTTDCDPLLTDFATHFIEPSPLLDEVLDFGRSPALFYGDDLDADLLPLVPSTPLSPASYSSSSSTPSSPERDSLEGYWSHSSAHTNDSLDFDTNLSEDFITNLLFSTEQASS